MIKRFSPLIILFFSFLIYGLFLSQFNVQIIEKTITPSHPENFYDYSGITHIHTNKSSGSGSLMDVVGAAQNSELNFIILTDLNQIPYQYIKPQYVNDLLIFSGHEYNYLNSKIINFFPEIKSRPGGLGQLQVQFSELLSQEKRDLKEGLFVVSHPYKKDNSWKFNNNIFVDGIEILNLKKIWQSQWQTSKLSFFWTFFLYPFNPRLSFLRLFDNPSKEIKLWDQLNLTHNTSGFSGADAEANFTLFSGLNFSYPTYEDIFQITKNHVLLKSELTGDFKRDAKKISDAITAGQFYFSLDLLANPKGFETYITNSKKSIVPMGSIIDYQKDLKLIVNLPRKPSVPFDVIYYKNGEKLIITNSEKSEVNIQGPGVYRVVVRVIPTLPLPDGRKWIPWIYSNPFYVK